MRIRTDGDKEYRKRLIERAADRYDCNRTEAIVRACEDVCHMMQSVEAVLEREDLTMKQRREIAERLSAPSVTFHVDSEVSTEF